MEALCAGLAVPTAISRQGKLGTSDGRCPCLRAARKCFLFLTPPAFAQQQDQTVAIGRSDTRLCCQGKVLIASYLPIRSAQVQNIIVSCSDHPQDLRT
jgi:hypothetical protein